MECKSLNDNLWKVLEADERRVELVSQRYGLPFIIAKIIALRDIPTEGIPDFLDPKIQNLLPNPYSLKDAEKASEKIAAAIIERQKIAIIGDYDVDGATSSALMALFLENCGLNPEVHIPEREEGYGPGNAAFDRFAAQGVTLVITTDCGTSAHEPVAYANSKGIEVIVIDHHEAEAKLPSAYAIVNPKRLDEDKLRPDLRLLSAVGVVFLSIVGINKKLREAGFYKDKPEPNLLNWLDLVALGTVCDVVPLQGLNRAFVRQGLKVLAQRKNPGLKALIDKSGISSTPDTFHLGYVLGPRINACGRVGDSQLGSRLLRMKENAQAEEIAEKMNKYNEERKEIESYVLLNAIEILEGTPQEYPMAFVAGKDWHQGVIGIVAGKLKERYNLPAFVLSIEDDEVKGSARSVNGVDLGALIIAAKEKGILTKGGGHMMAAGFSLEETKIEEFKQFVGDYIREKVGDEKIAPVIEIDAALDLLGATTELSETLSLLEPYGAGNREPRLMLKNVRISRPKIVGSGHVSCFLTSGNGGNLKAVAFRCADTQMGKSLLNSNGECFNIIGNIRVDNWQGRNSAQFIIEDAMKG